MKSADLCGIEVSQGHILLSKLAQFDSNGQACAFVNVCDWRAQQPGRLHEDIWLALIIPIDEYLGSSAMENQNKLITES